MLPSMAEETQAATAGFKTTGGKTYYIDANGQKHKGWLTLNGKKYYFDTKTGVQLKGWMKNSSGQNIRYFTSGKGYMVTGFLTDSKGNTRYFTPGTGLMVRGWMTDSAGNKYYFSKGAGIMAKGWLTDSKNQKRYFSKASGRLLTGWLKSSANNYRYFKKDTGVMLTGLQKIGNYYYYLNKSTGIRYEKGWLNVGSNRYYFASGTGRAKTGWMTLSGKKYYFRSTGALLRSTSTVIDGKAYTFDAAGVATASKYTVINNNIKVYDAKNNKYYYMAKEFIEHPGIADGKLTDRDLLAALCDSEAGDQGLIGMEAVALCILNRTIKSDKEFPSEVKLVIYQALSQGSSLAQYSVIKDGAYLKRLKGQYSNKTNAYKAADAALKIFNNYVTKGTPRKLTGFKQDFNYMYFMMEASFWKQPLNFKKVEYFKYKSHMFFVDWVS